MEENVVFCYPQRVMMVFKLHKMEKAHPVKTASPFMLQTQDSLLPKSSRPSLSEKIGLIAPVNSLEVDSVLKFTVNQICECRCNHITA